MKRISTFIIATSILTLTGCSFVDVDVRSTETGYMYQEDINDSQRYNPGSDYFTHWIGEVDPRIIYTDYGIKTIPFSASYTLPTEQKITIDVEAEILFKLQRNPKEKNGQYLTYSEDDYVRYFAESVSPIADKSRDYALIVSPIELWTKLMSEPTDLAFRSIFTDADTYSSFDIVESSIVEIQKALKEQLGEKSNNHYIEVVGIKIKDIPVPAPIADSRAENLRLGQNAINQVRELEIKSRNAAMQMAVDVRYAMNDVIVDGIVSSKIDKGYMLMETLRKGVENGNSMEINLTPDFIRYLEGSGTQNSNKQSNADKELFDKLNKMTDEELMTYFKKGGSSE
jgi:regulator of protease activity HflC (stomatin/prohibitin superfamily)